MTRMTRRTWEIDANWKKKHHFLFPLIISTVKVFITKMKYYDVDIVLPSLIVISVHEVGSQWKLYKGI